MTNLPFILRHLCFTGPGKQPALVTFDRGLNVIYGASETGKSFILESIDFMLGGSIPLRDLPERVGYDRIFLGLEIAGDSSFTFVRAVNGGQFELYEGLHQSVPAGIKPMILAERHSANNDENLSSFLLSKIGLNGKRVRKNSRGETNNLSFRNICHLCLVSEGDIQKQGSPIESDQVVLRTPENATFKLLLTGVDDSAIVSVSKSRDLSQSKASAVAFIDELLVSYKEKVGEDNLEDLKGQLSKIESMVAEKQQVLRVSEEQYQSLVDRRTDFRHRHENGSERRGEIKELLARFALLDESYRSDLARLEGIREAGLLVAVLSPQTCPLCGADPAHQHRDKNCDGNLEANIAAVDVESAKIKQLRRELEETVRQLKHEGESFDRLLPKLIDEAHNLEAEIQKLGAGLTDKRIIYSDLIEKRSAVRAKLLVWDQITDFNKRRKELESVLEGTETQPKENVDLSSTILDQFAQQVEQVLKAWNFPDSKRVHFDQADHDIVINGKRRGSRGKGLRAITHAAFIIGILEFCRAQDRPHPGFLILDSPLLAYREPDGTEDDLRGTDVQDKFYEYLARWTDKQVIIIENIDPPADIKSRPTSIFFSQNPHQGRYGFFPKPL